MKEKYLVINAGSSSLKFALYNMPGYEEIVNGNVEKIGESDGLCTLKFNGQKIKKEAITKNHTEAIRIMIMELLGNNFIMDINEIKGVGHRVLHGGEFYSESVIIDEKVIENIVSLTKFGPLHHPGELEGIRTMMKLLPNAIEVAVFDTAFHQTIPKENFLYATPYEWYKENSVRKYGFHGTSHKYITEEMIKEYHKNNVNLIICHLGSGASISCVKDGKCFDTTMGLTPLDGLIMGTRSGSIDPSIVEYICHDRNLTVEQVNTILNTGSGLMGIVGKNDFRDVEKLAAVGDKKAQLALIMMKKSIIKYIAEYYVELDGNVDALVFTAGIGENNIPVRKEIVDKISKPLGVKIDDNANNNISKVKRGKISLDDSNFDIYVIPTNEEYMILKDTYQLENNKIKSLRRNH